MSKNKSPIFLVELHLTDYYCVDMDCHDMDENNGHNDTGNEEVKKYVVFDSAAADDEADNLT